MTRIFFIALSGLLVGCDTSKKWDDKNTQTELTYELKSDQLPIFREGEYVVYESQLKGLEWFPEPFTSRLTWVSSEQVEDSLRLQHHLPHKSPLKWLNSDWVFVPWSKGWQLDRIGGYSAQDLNSAYLPIWAESPLFIGKSSKSVMRLTSNTHHSPIYGYAEIEVTTQQEITSKHWVSTPMGAIQCFEMHYQQEWKPNKPAHITDDQFEGVIEGDLCLHPKLGFISHHAHLRPSKSTQPPLEFNSVLKRTNISL